jgi:hypothetical protein
MLPYPQKHRSIEQELEPQYEGLVDKLDAAELELEPERQRQEAGDEAIPVALASNMVSTEKHGKRDGCDCPQAVPACMQLLRYVAKHEMAQKI